VTCEARAIALQTVTKRRLHVLIIPSEEYLPAQDPLAGIFQKHQLDALSSYRTDRFGLISIRLVYSLPMILKAGVYRLAHRRVANELGGAEVGELKRLLAQHLFRPASAIRIDRYPSLNILRLNALCILPFHLANRSTGTKARCESAVSWS
jgi:hypothetical protein